MLPFKIEGGPVEILRVSSPTLDKNFLAKSMETNNACLALNCSNDMMKFEMKFPVPKE
jgi:hypothetical protein